MFLNNTKYSGIDYIGYIPADWNIAPAKYLSSFRMGQTILKEDLIDDGIYPVYSATEKDTIFGYINSPSFLLKSGDIVIPARGNSIGFVKLVNYESISTQTTIANFIESDKINGKFLFYFYGAFRKQLFAFEDTAIPMISVEKIKENKIPVPPMSTQNRIAEFLDKKTSEIDAIIEKKKNLLLLLEEKKIAIINEAVTKGLNPNASMKDSGIEWIGEIPELWKMKPLGYLGSCQNGVSKGGDYFGEGYPFVNYGDIYKNYELPTQVEGLAKSSEEDREAYSVLYGDVFFTRTSETIEEIGIASTCLKTIENSVFSGFTIRFRPYSLKELCPSYCKYFFRSNYVRVSLIKQMNLVTRASLSQTLLKALRVILPPYEEQKNIVLYLQNQFQIIDEAKEKIDLQIDKLKEYRQSLISEAVTGKIDI